MRQLHTESHRLPGVIGPVPHPLWIRALYSVVICVYHEENTASTGVYPVCPVCPVCPVFPVSSCRFFTIRLLLRAIPADRIVSSLTFSSPQNPPLQNFRVTYTRRTIGDTSIRSASVTCLRKQRGTRKWSPVSSLFSPAKETVASRLGRRGRRCHSLLPPLTCDGPLC